MDSAPNSRQDKPNVDFQAKLIDEILKTPLEKNQTWYLIERTWMKAFRMYVGLDESERHELPKHPGPVNNAALLDNFGYDIRNGLVEGLDFVLVPELAWQMLISWYGLALGQQPIARKTIEFGTFVKHCKVEVYLIRLNLCNNFELLKPVVFQFSAADLIQKIETVMRNIFQISSVLDVRLWGSYASGQFDLLPVDKVIQEIPLAQNQYVVIESKRPDEQWEPPMITTKKFLKHLSYAQVPPVTTKASTLKYIRPSPSMPPVTRKTASSTGMGVTGYGSATKPGLSGLVNIGNTCFMNSIIQCLSHCPPLTQYFLNNLYLSDINCNNILGANGEVAKCFGDLMHMLWSGKHTSIVPDRFKLKVGQFSTHFSGGSQQDSQEFMVYFLDLLHEDLNRVSIKPLTPPVSYDSHPEEGLADEETWVNYKKKNDSIIVDNFHGLLKSRVVCPTCERVSATFDPFVFLSLPLLMRKERELQVRHIPFNQSQVIADYLVSVPCEGDVRDLYLEMARFSHVSIEHMIFAEVVGNHCHGFYSSDDPISSIRENASLLMFDVPVEMGTMIESHIIMPVVLWEGIQTTGQEGSTYRIGTLFGNPFIVVLPTGEMTYQALYNLITARMTRYIGGCFMMPPTSHTSCGDEGMQVGDDAMPLRLFAVNSIDYSDAREILNNGSLITFEESMGREFIAVRWTRAARVQWFRESVPVYHDTVACRGALKLTLEDCLSMFVTAEKLGADDTWICPDCNIYKRASKKFDLWHLPPVLVVHLKRFAYNKGKRDKIDAFVDFPIVDLHMEKYTCMEGQEPVIYDLFAVCNHYGVLHAGHYTAYAKNQNDGKWYCFDDNIVTVHKETKIVTSAAYLLFYIRRENKVPKVPTTSLSASSSAAPLHSTPAEMVYSSASVAAPDVDSTTTSHDSPVGSESTVGSGSVDSDTGIESDADADADMPLTQDDSDV